MISLIFFMRTPQTNISFCFNSMEDAKAVHDLYLEAVKTNPDALIQIEDCYGKFGTVVAGDATAVVRIDQDKDRALSEELQMKAHRSNTSLQRRAQEEASRVVVPQRGNGPIMVQHG